MAENSKRIAVTGGHGKVGTTLVPYLKDKGYEVFIIDRDAPTDPNELAMVAGPDRLRPGTRRPVVRRRGHLRPRRTHKAFDVVVHLASIPHPRMLPDSDEFRLNMMATYNVFEAARRLAIKDIVWAASESASACRSTRPTLPTPGTRTTQCAATTSYALTKVLGEEMARQFSASTTRDAHHLPAAV